MSDDDDDGDVDNNDVADGERGEDDIVELSTIVDEDKGVIDSTEIDHKVDSSIITKLPSIFSWILILTSYSPGA